MNLILLGVNSFFPIQEKICHVHFLIVMLNLARARGIEWSIPSLLELPTIPPER